MSKEKYPINPLTNTKICSKCLLDKPTNEFYLNTKKTQLMSECKQCIAKRSIIRREKYINNYNTQYSNIKEKECSTCKETQNIKNFGMKKDTKNGYASQCKNCVMKYYYKNKERIDKQSKEYKIANKAELNEKSRQSYKDNPEKYKQIQKLYIENNLEKVKKARKIFASKPETKLKKLKSDKIRRQTEKHKEYRRQYLKRRRKNDPAFKITLNLRNTMKKALNGIKSDRSMSLLGNSPEEIKIYLESKFTDGMSWENYGYYGWHIDHIIPCAVFDLTDPEQQKKCFHYTNLQPLWAKDNMAKGDKLDYSIAQSTNNSSHSTSSIIAKHTDSDECLDCFS